MTIVACLMTGVGSGIPPLSEVAVWKLILRRLTSPA